MIEDWIAALFIALGVGIGTGVGAVSAFLLLGKYVGVFKEDTNG